ncbi:MAG: S-adenosylmethionine synthetase [Gammaproteobacteria bacterium SG8_11]|nr:MAG: S-adenosylmethionine synthetase [Gammaproteobacteria bacterium SG8_11]
MKSDFVFTSESVSAGHPDKLCDLISDAIVDKFLIADPYSRILAESAVANGVVFISARFVSKASVDIPQVARDVIQQINYTGTDFNANDCSILTNFSELPSEQYVAIDEANLAKKDYDKFPAKNHATIFGFACTQTRNLMPLPIHLAHGIVKQLDNLRLQNTLPYLLPDATAQVAIEYRKQKPYRVHSINLITAHEKLNESGLDSMREEIIEQVLKPVIEQETVRFDDKSHVYINPAGPITKGGPAVHSGLTGRKNATDTYGQYCRHSAAALSGKDPSRIDRTGNYIARYAAKNIVAAGMAEECEVQLSYTIEQSNPVSIQVETFGTGKLDDIKLAQLLQQHFDFRPAAIIAQFNLRHLPALTESGFYKKLASYGHFGRSELELPWEQTDKTEMLRK